MRSIRPSIPTLTAMLMSVIALAVIACGPSVPDNNNEDCPDANLENDIFNCGACNNTCGTGELCIEGECSSDCDPGDTVDCYDGLPVTQDVGPCRGGTRTCLPSGNWGECAGQVVPTLEVCGNGLDENCSGEADEDVDEDGDGFTTCQGDCCDQSECTRPELVNPGAFDAGGNALDDDCDGQVDNTQTVCDLGLTSNSPTVTDYAKAMDICQTATETSRRWGVIDATFTTTSGSGTAATEARSIRPMFGTGLVPQAGMAFTLLASGNAAAPGQTAPPHVNFTDSADFGIEAPPPNDWYQANGGRLPNAPGCPEPNTTEANDPIMLTMRIRVPSNAKSFSFASNFYSSEYPEYTCTAFNDFFVVLLDSAWATQPLNPADKNLAFYRSAGGMTYPVGVNLASGNTGLFTQCINGTLGCADIFGGGGGTISTCTSTAQLTGTGFDVPDPDNCDSNSLSGGGTGWLQTSGNVVGGEIITLRIAIWDTSDHILDSLVVLDNFQWSVDVSDPGTVIGRQWGAGAATPLGHALFGR
jgi:hypothetical protein